MLALLRPHENGVAARHNGNEWSPTIHRQAKSGYRDENCYIACSEHEIGQSEGSHECHRRNAHQRSRHILRRSFDIRIQSLANYFPAKSCLSLRACQLSRTARSRGGPGHFQYPEIDGLHKRCFTHNTRVLLTTRVLQELQGAGGASVTACFRAGFEDESPTVRLWTVSALGSHRPGKAV